MTTKITNKTTRVQNSLSDFERIYNLTLLTYAVKREDAVCSKGFKKCWSDLVQLWDAHHKTGGATDLFYQALYHIQWRKLPVDNQDKNHVRLVEAMESC